MRLLVADEVADVGVYLGEDKSDVVSEADLSTPDGFNGRRTALVIVCERCIQSSSICGIGNMKFLKIKFTEWDKFLGLLTRIGYVKTSGF